jgi:DNA-binding protein H-NS
MSMKKIDLESMTLDDLWSLHEEISTILLTRIQAEKLELEKRLAVLNPGMSAIDEIGDPDVQIGKPRRKYPQVLPKYRNPQTSETWSGRGKQPRWLVAAIKLGHSMDEFRIGESGGTSRRPS